MKKVVFILSLLFVNSSLFGGVLRFTPHQKMVHSIGINTTLSSAYVIDRNIQLLFQNGESNQLPMLSNISLIKGEKLFWDQQQFSYILDETGTEEIRKIQGVSIPLQIDGEETELFRFEEEEMRQAVTQAFGGQTLNFLYEAIFPKLDFEELEEGETYEYIVYRDPLNTRSSFESDPWIWKYKIIKISNDRVHVTLNGTHQGHALYMVSGDGSWNIRNASDVNFILIHLISVDGQTKTTHIHISSKDLITSTP